MNSVVRTVSIETEVTSGDFRNAMRQSDRRRQRHHRRRGRDISGMTVTSVSSLSVDPPSLIVSINRESSSWPLVKRYGFFGVNILTSDQIDIAERFTGKGGLKGADRFAGARLDDARLRRAAAGRRAGGDRLRGRGYRRAAFACDRHRPRAGCCSVGAHRGAGLLAGALCRHRSGRGCGEACRGQRAGRGSTDAQVLTAQSSGAGAGFSAAADLKPGE